MDNIILKPSNFSCFFSTDMFYNELIYLKSVLVHVNKLIIRSKNHNGLLQFYIPKVRLLTKTYLNGSKQTCWQ